MTDKNSEQDESTLTREQALEIYLAGFMASGEGYNGEIPFDTPYIPGRGSPTDDERFVREFDRWWGRYSDE